MLGRRSLALLLVKQAAMFPRTAWQAFPMAPPALSTLLPGMLGSPAGLWSSAKAVSQQQRGMTSLDKYRLPFRVTVFGVCDSGAYMPYRK